MKGKDINEIIENLIPGHIYYLSYGPNTQLVGRVKKVTSMQIEFFSQIHCWNGFINFYHSNAWSVTTGISEIRRATKIEKHSLIKYEIEHECC